MVPWLFPQCLQLYGKQYNKQYAHIIRVCPYNKSMPAVGAVLQQGIEGQLCPITYFSKQLHAAQKWYSTFDWELWAIYPAVKHFWHFVEGRQFVIFTDYIPLGKFRQVHTETSSTSRLHISIYLRRTPC